MILKEMYDLLRGKASYPTIIFSIIVFVLSNLTQIQADIIFPARIEMKETTPGEFAVLFTLPIINNNFLSFAKS